MVLRVQDFLHNALEVLFAHTTVINGWLALKVNVDWQLQLVLSIDWLHVDNLLKRVVKDVLTVNFHHVRRCSLGIAPHLRVKEGSHDEVVSDLVRDDSVVIMDHDGDVVRVEDPVEGAEVKLVGVRDWLGVADLDLGGLDPLGDGWVQVKVVVDGIVIELFLLNLVFLVRLESKVYPVNDIEHFHARDEQLHFGDTCDDVDRNQTLQLHHVLEQLGA